MKSLASLKKRIKKNEGYRNAAYVDILGFSTIGYGHLIKKNEKYLLVGTFSKKYLSSLFNEDFNKAVNDYNKNYKLNKFPTNVKEVLIEMIYQLGINKQKKFKKMNKYIQKNLFYMAALEMKKSLWFQQTPKRVHGLIKILLKNNYEKKR